MKKVVVFCIVLSLISFSIQAKVKKIFKEGSKIYLEATTCDEIEITGKIISEDPCKMDITGSLDPFIVEWAGKTTFEDGPNCWNSALILQGIMEPDITHVLAEEIEYIAEVKGVCEEVESPSVGDMIYIYDPHVKPEEGWRAIHAFTYLGNGWSFTKNGYRSHKPYQFATVNAVKKEFGATTSARKIAYYRCEPIKYKNAVSKKVDRALSDIANNMVPIIIHKKDYTKTQFEEIKRFLNKQEELLDSDDANPDEAYALKYRIKSLKYQIKLIIDPPPLNPHDPYYPW